MGAPPSQRQRWMQRENQRQARRDRDRDRVRQRQDGGHKLRDERRQVMETQHVRDGETQRETQRQRPGSAPTPIHTDRHRGRGPGRAGQPPLPLQARPGQAAPGPGQWALVRAPEEPASWGGLWAGPRRRGGHNSCWVGEGAPPGGLATASTLRLSSSPGLPSWGLCLLPAYFLCSVWGRGRVFMEHLLYAPKMPPRLSSDRPPASRVLGALYLFLLCLWLLPRKKQAMIKHLMLHRQFP